MSLKSCRLHLGPSGHLRPKCGFQATFMGSWAQTRSLCSRTPRGAWGFPASVTLPYRTVLLCRRHRPGSPRGTSVCPLGPAAPSLGAQASFTVPESSGSRRVLVPSARTGPSSAHMPSSPPTALLAPPFPAASALLPLPPGSLPWHPVALGAVGCPPSAVLCVHGCQH